MAVSIKTKVMFKTTDDVRDFCYTASALPRNINVIVHADNGIANGKSLLNMLSFNFSKIKPPVFLTVSSEYPVDKEDILRRFNPWIFEDKESENSA